MKVFTTIFIISYLAFLVWGSFHFKHNNARDNAKIDKEIADHAFHKGCVTGVITVMVNRDKKMGYDTYSKLVDECYKERDR